jgi:hypothetical protein
MGSFGACDEGCGIEARAAPTCAKVCILIAPYAQENPRLDTVARKIEIMYRKTASIESSSSVLQ